MRLVLLTFLSCVLLLIGPVHADDSVDDVRQRAASGDSRAQVRLGVMYVRGKAVPQSHEEANKWFRMAAEKGDRSAEYYLGLSYYNGLAVEKDNFEASVWFRKSAEQGFARAQFRLGGMYLRGYGVVKDDRVAAAWLLRAANQGHSQAQYFIGMMYLEGRGVAKSQVEGYAWLRVAAAAGLERADERLDEISSGLTEVELAEAGQLALKIEQMNNPESVPNTVLDKLPITDQSPDSDPAKPGDEIAGTAHVALAGLILLVTACFAFLVIWIFRGVKRWLAERVERQYHGYGGYMAGETGPIPVHRWLPFRTALATNLVMTACAWLVIVYSPPDPAEALVALVTGDYLAFLTQKNRMTWPVLIPVMTFYFLAFREHLRPGNNRQRKYDYVLAGIISMWIGNAFFDSVINGTTGPLLGQLVAGLLLLTVIPAILEKLIPAKKPPGRFARIVYTFLKVSTPAIIFLFLVVLVVPWVFIPYLLIRFLYIRWFEKYPIVYLRSFSQQSAPQVFRKIVSRECNRQGVLVALVHGSQTGTDLRGDAPVYEGSQFAVVPDAHWQAWVSSQLQSARAVIIDDTVETDGVGWEIAHAQQNCDPHKIVILRSSASQKDRFAGLCHLSYEENMSDVRATRRQLRHWLASA